MNTKLQSIPCFSSYLDLLLHIVEDESLRMDEVVGGVEWHGVQRAAVNTAPVHRSAGRLRPDQPLDGRDEGLETERERETKPSSGPDPTVFGILTGSWCLAVPAVTDR